MNTIPKRRLIVQTNEMIFFLNRIREEELPPSLPCKVIKTIDSFWFK